MRGTLYQRMCYNHVGSDDGTVRLWEVQSGRCRKVWEMGAKVRKVQWNPNPTISILAVAVYALSFLIHIWFSSCNLLLWICFSLSPLTSFDDHDREKDVVLLPTELGDEEANASVSSLLSLKNVEVPENEPSMSTSTLYFKKLMHSECMYERTCYIYPWGRLCLLVCKFSLPVEVFCLQTHRR